MRRSARHMDSRGFFSAEEYASAYRQAQRESCQPARGRRGSAVNLARQRQGTKLSTRALQILWLRRALGSTYGTGGAQKES